MLKIPSATLASLCSFSRIFFPLWKSYFVRYLMCLSDDDEQMDGKRFMHKLSVELYCWREKSLRWCVCASFCIFFSKSGTFVILSPTSPHLDCSMLIVPLSRQRSFNQHPTSTSKKGFSACLSSRAFQMSKSISFSQIQARSRHATDMMQYKRTWLLIDGHFICKNRFSRTFSAWREKLGVMM